MVDEQKTEPKTEVKGKVYPENQIQDAFDYLSKKLDQNTKVQTPEERQKEQDELADRLADKQEKRAQEKTEEKNALKSYNNIMKFAKSTVEAAEKKWGKSHDSSIKGLISDMCQEVSEEGLTGSEALREAEKRVKAQFSELLGIQTESEEEEDVDEDEDEDNEMDDEDEDEDDDATLKSIKKKLPKETESTISDISSSGNIAGMSTSKYKALMKKIENNELPLSEVMALKERGERYEAAQKAKKR